MHIILVFRVTLENNKKRLSSTTRKISSFFFVLFSLEYVGNRAVDSHVYNTLNISQTNLDDDSMGPLNTMDKYTTVVPIPFFYPNFRPRFKYNHEFINKKKK